MASKKRKIDLALAGMDELKRKQILSEIRSIRIQSAIAILTVVGSCIAFVVIQNDRIRDIMSKNPTVAIICDDNFVNRIGTVVIVNSDSTEKFESEIRNLKNEIELKPGSYRIVVICAGETIWNESFILQKNESRSVHLPRFYESRIRVLLKNTTPFPKPGQRLEVEINSSGNGFLWIYERLKNDSIKVLFPVDQEISEGRHVINASKTFSFDDDLYLAVGKEIRQEEYFFLVTSVNDRKYANSIVNIAAGTTLDIEKAEMTHLVMNWGMESLKVDIR